MNTLRRWLDLSFLDEAAPNADIFIRLLVGVHLIIGTQDNVFSWARMLEFRDFLATRGVPFPLFSAHLSAYAQFLCGILYVFGLFTRYAAIAMIVNFCAALIIAHLGVGYQATFPALAMLFGSIYLLIHGAGGVSIDAKLKARQKSEPPRAFAESKR